VILYAVENIPDLLYKGVGRNKQTFKVSQTSEVLDTEKRINYNAYTRYRLTPGIWWIANLVTIKAADHADRVSDQLLKLPP